MSTTGPKHILIIMGSPRKGNTLHACEMFREFRKTMRKDLIQNPGACE